MSKIAYDVVEALQKRKLTLTTAESCTGGMVASSIVDVPGASDILMQGIVTYSNAAKMKYLGVSEETLKAHGAVSYETAYEMAGGAAKMTGTACGVATTGIAGPGGGTPLKPVGTVYIAASVNGHTEVKLLHLNGTRSGIRTSACEEALALLYDTVLKYA